MSLLAGGGEENVTYTITVQVEGFQEAMKSRLMAVARPVEAAMAARFYQNVLMNFGEVGYDRPERWPGLSASYAKRMGRVFATLYVSGALYDAVKLNPAEATVSVSNADVPYAMVHQFGGGNNIPARPYFPIEEDGTLTRRSARDVRVAAIEALRRELA